MSRSTSTLSLSRDAGLVTAPTSPVPRIESPPARTHSPDVLFDNTRLPRMSTSQLIQFYKGQCRDHRGRYLDDILHWDDAHLETSHTFMQTLFPLPEGSVFASWAPRVDLAMFQIFRSRDDLRERVFEAFSRLLRFWGFRVSTRTADFTDIEPTLNFNDARRRWLRRIDLNHLRMTRMLRSMRYLGLEVEARAFYDALLEAMAAFPDIISDITIGYWTRAIEEAIEAPDAVEEDEYRLHIRASTLTTSLPALAEQAETLQHAVPRLDEEIVRFTNTYAKSAENALLDRRRKAMLLSRNVDRLSDILDLPSLLSSAISSSSSSSSASGTAVTPGGQAPAVSSTNYASALDLHAHIKRLRTLYPNSLLVSQVSAQADEAMRGMTTSLISSLKAPGIKFPAAMRTIGWLRRVAPDLDDSGGARAGYGNEGSLGALFLVCRLANLLSTLEALLPLRELADQELAKRLERSGPSRAERDQTSGSMWSGGQQTERFLKRYIEIFREQSFAIISTYRSIFPSTLSPPNDLTKNTTKLSGSEPSVDQSTGAKNDPLLPLPSALATFPLHLVGVLTETLKRYLPNVRDRSSRDSLLTQVLYCAGSLGRLGGDFSMMLASLDDLSSDSEDESDDEQDEWVEIVKKHRVQAGRLELLASGIGGHEGPKGSSKEVIAAGSLPSSAD
ncbi:MAG: hypothetical protein M1825_005874 [Sarcosagium campestre]|nr:MAG: hypothetical protein M1825_005874 [Sarcosagium campestre]